jgi:hypothetical protein
VVAVKTVQYDAAKLSVLAADRNRNRMRRFAANVVLVPWP